MIQDSTKCGHHWKAVDITKIFLMQVGCTFGGILDDVPLVEFMYKR